MSHAPHGAKQRAIDHYVVIGLVLIAVPITILGELNFLLSTLLFFGIPSAYLIYRCPRNFKKAALAGLTIGLVGGFTLDFVAEFNHAWGWAVDFALPAHFFGLVSLDVLIWFFFWVFLVVAYYEYFIEHDRSTKICPRWKWIFTVLILLAAITVLVWKIAPELMTLRYAYAELGTLVFLVCALLTFKNPGLFRKTLRTVPFFAFMYLSYEITALYLNLWTFPGAYLGSVTVGTLMFPLEELVVWIIASSAIVAMYYEFCIDDYK